MCGIAGYFSNTNTISGRDFYKAHRKMAHRGPDDEGFLVVNENKPIIYNGKYSQIPDCPVEDICLVGNISCILSHVRLSILDLSFNGHQPMVSENESISLSYNGEIYNYLELRHQLKLRGYHFKSNSDTEVVMYAYKEWGVNAFSKFNGMWAIAIFDHEKGELVLSRDRFGIKPLFYSYSDETITFASEMKVILDLIKNKSVNIESVRKYMEQCSLFADDHTFYNAINEVKPAHYMVFKKGNLKEDAIYWEFFPSKSSISENDAIQRFGELFTDSVHLRMRSDVNVGSLLSGGLDSSSIVGIMGRDGLLTSKYATFSAVYDVDKYSEKKYIDCTQEMWDINCNCINIQPDEILCNLDKALWHSEVPIRSIAYVLQCILYGYICNNSEIKVVLNGQGADELFGGYTGDYFLRFQELLCTDQYGMLFKEANTLHKNREISYYNIYKNVLKNYLKLHNYKDNTFNVYTFQNMVTTPFREYLMYDDRASMAYGIEARAPFLDYRLVEFAFTLPSSYKIDNMYNKKIVREYVNGIVDKNIIQRKDKMGFTSPQEMWQKKEWKHIFDNEFEEIKKNDLFCIDGRKAYSSYIDYKNNKFDNWLYIWRLFCLSRWKKCFIGD